jgi:very long chain acyl-CoA dehydrogenase
LQENGWLVCDEAIQLHGGMGFMRECGLERVLRDLRIFRIFEGANDVMRLFVALTGMQYAGKHLQHMAKEIKSGGLSTIFGELKRRTIGDSSSDFSASVHSSLKNEATSLSTCIGLFGSTVEGLLTKHRKGIIDRQYELIRVANALIDIYSMAAVISRCGYVLQKDSNSTHDLEITKLFVAQASKRALENLKEASNAKETEMRQISNIAQSICANQSMIQKHPVNI